MKHYTEVESGPAYTAAELKAEHPSAFERAYVDWQQHNLDYEWWDSCYESFQTAAKILGLDVSEKDIYFSGFWSQGDGASYNGSYSYRAGSCKAIRDEFPRAEELHKIADALRDAQRPYFYQLSASIRASHRGHFLHVDVSDDRDVYADIDEDSIAEPLRDLANWLYQLLESDYEYLQSEESFIESSDANGWFYTESGRMVDESYIDAA